MGPNTTSNTNQTRARPAQTGQLLLGGMSSTHDLLEHDNKSERPIYIYILESKAVVYTGGGGYEAIWPA